MFEYGETIEKIKKYAKYLVLLIPIIVLLIILRSCGGAYSKLESEVEEKALNYVKEKSISIVGERYIEIGKIGDFEDAGICSSASGVIVKNENGKLVAKAYLECGNYRSSIVSNKEKYIKLNVGDVMLLNLNEVFIDPGYTLSKDDLRVVTSGNVLTSAGVYTVTYNVYDGETLKETAIRKVIVTTVDKTTKVSGLESLTEPTLTLKGDTEIYLSVNEVFNEPGYTAIDYKDGPISRKVIVKPDPKRIDTSRVKEVPITYTVTNSAGKTTTKIRILRIVKKKSNLNISVITKSDQIASSSIIDVTVTGEGYKNMRIANGGSISDKHATYTATKNGEYKISVYDLYGNEYIKRVTISNIDDTLPTGSCHAVVNSRVTKIEVNASDNKGVAGFNYIIDNEQTGYMATNVYEKGVKASNVKVKVKDVVGNESLLNCSIEQKTIITSNSCGGSDILVDVETCFGDRIIKRDIPLEEYLMGVLYGEEDPAPRDSMEYVKAFVIFARTYSFNHNKSGNRQHLLLKSCNMDQNWCDLEQGCYREQDDQMFSECIQFSLDKAKYNGGKPYYTAAKCASRVTTFPGSKPGLTNQTYYVNNPNWPSNYDTVATGEDNKASWKPPASSKSLAILRQAVEETAGMVLLKPNGELTNIGYMMCENYEAGHEMCADKAEIMANDMGYTMEEIIKAFSKDYPDAVIGCIN